MHGDSPRNIPSYNRTASMALNTNYTTLSFNIKTYKNHEKKPEKISMYLHGSQLKPPKLQFLWDVGWGGNPASLPYPTKLGKKTPQEPIEEGHGHLDPMSADV